MNLGFNEINVHQTELKDLKKTTNNLFQIQISRKSQDRFASLFNDWTTVKETGKAQFIALPGPVEI